MPIYVVCKVTKNYAKLFKVSIYLTNCNGKNGKKTYKQFFIIAIFYVFRIFGCILAEF